MDSLNDKVKILLIEDDPFDAEKLKLHLQHIGHFVVGEVSTGEAAIARAEQDEFDLMLVDIVLRGDLDGIETARLIHEKHNIPAIFITAHSSDELLLRAERVGPFAYLLKPYQQRELELVINMSLARIQVEKELMVQMQQAEDEQLRAQEELLKQKEILQRVLENIPYAVFWKDRESNYLGCNANFARDAGLESPEETINMSDYDLPWRPEEAEFYRHMDQMVMESGEPQLNFEESLSKADGSAATLLTSKVPLTDDDGNIMGMLGIYTDITERKKQEEQLRHAQKMDALGKLTGGVAHDFNNVLGIILGYLELIEGQLDNQPKLAKYTYQMRHATERGANLTRKLLAFSQLGNSDPKLWNLNSLLLGQHDLLEKTITARVKLIFDLSDNLWPVLVDSGDLEDAIINMSINAMHAIEGNGQLTIETHNKHIDASDAHVLQIEPGDYVQLNISDTGCGMDEATIEKIFEPFYTTKGEGGTGLGLAQVYGFVARSLGTLKVYSEPGHGTVLSVYFPRHPEGIGDSASKIDNMPEQSPGSETILIVDDEPALLDLSSEILQLGGYKTLLAMNAKQALEVLENESVDLMLSDVIMPDMGGYELANIVQQQYPAVKIQLVSGFSGSTQKEVDSDLQKHTLQKPYHAQSLLKKIRELLDEKSET